MQRIQGFALTLGVLLTVLHVSEAARRVDAHLRARETMRMRRARTEFYKRDGLQGYQEPDLDVKELLQLTEGENLTVKKVMANVQGTKVERLEETYHGIPVYDAVVTVRTDKQARPTGDASGELIQDIDKDLPDLTPALTDDQLLQIVLQAEGDNFEDGNIGDVQLTKIIYTDYKEVAHLASQVSYFNKDLTKQPMYIVDAKSGEVLDRWQGLNSKRCDGNIPYNAYGGNEKVGKIHYGDMPFCLDMKEVNGTCHLENEYVRVVDMNFTEDETINETAKFPCEEGYLDTVNGGYSPAIDALFYGTIVGKMYEDWYETTPLDVKQIQMRVHYSTNYDDAFWKNGIATFGDGNEDFHPFMSLDVVSHEIAHGVTDESSGARYMQESGGINEAFSDVMGEAAEMYFYEYTDFWVGNDYDKNTPGYRQFENPSSDGSSIDNVSDMVNCLDPHDSSGVFRRVFYLVVKQFKVPIKQAAHVFLQANRMYWHATSTFYDASCGILRAALDLGLRSAPYKRAFADVGMKPCDVDSHIFTLNLDTVNFQPNVTVSWDIKPIFKVDVWIDDVTEVLVIAESASGRDCVMIKALRNTWTEDDDGNPTNVVANGETWVSLPDPGRDVFYLQFESVNGLKITDVTIEVRSNGA